MTGDIMHLIGNNTTEKLDSLKVLNNAFIIQKDTLSSDGYNQIKGQNLYGKFKDNKLSEVDVVKNAEVIYYMYNDDNDLIGIDKKKASSINFEFEDNQIISQKANNQVESKTYPDIENFEVLFGEAMNEFLQKTIYFLRKRMKCIMKCLLRAKKRPLKMKHQ
jgi:hypothetical protein